ncbi:MAG: hypothetical protein J6V53_00695 [Alphaproteobacteria bacterium]|nr:hypothetical protein [Alphaproteobacteria bacterium]
MTTKLNKKLRYAVETKSLITKALQNKGAIVDEKMPFRALTTAIDNLQTQSPSKNILSAYPLPLGEKAMIQKHQYDLPAQKGAFMGALKGCFGAQPYEFAFVHQDQLHLGWYNGQILTYQLDKENHALIPLNIRKSTIKSTTYTFPNPGKTTFGSNYHFSPEKESPFTEIAYPTGGNFNNFEPSYCSFDSKGEYLIQYNSYNSIADVLKLVYNEDEEAYAYEIIASIPQQNHPYYYVFNRGAGDIHTSNTFTIGGKTIFKINSETNEISSFSIENLPIEGENFDLQKQDVLLFGQNYLILVNYTGSQQIISFIKTTPIDETLASSDEGFYDNPTNYSYQIIHQETAKKMPPYALCHHAGDIYSPKQGELNYYIYPHKKRIEDMSDFSYEFGTSEDTITLVAFFDANTCVSYGTRTLSNTRVNTTLPVLFERENPTLKFNAQEPVFNLPCAALNEHGFGLFYYNGSHYLYDIINNKISSTAKHSVSNALVHNIFMKNGRAFGFIESEYFYLSMPGKSGSHTVIFRAGFKGVVDEDLLSNTLYNNLIYYSDTGEQITLTNNSFTTNNTYCFVFKYKGEYYFFDFNGKKGEKVSGTVQKVTLDIENKTFHLGEQQPAFGTFETQLHDFMVRIKTKDLLITKSKMFGVKEEDHTLHFTEINFPDELIQSFEGKTPYLVQTYYDGSVGFLFDNGKTIIAFLDWDGKSQTAHLQKNKTIQTVLPPVTLNESFYTVLSPFKIYQSIYRPYDYFIYTKYFSENQKEKHLYHLTPNTKENFNETSIIGEISSELQQDEDGYPIQKISLVF